MYGRTDVDFVYISCDIYGRTVVMYGRTAIIYERTVVMYGRTAIIYGRTDWTSACVYKVHTSTCMYGRTERNHTYR